MSMHESKLPQLRNESYVVNKRMNIFMNFSNYQLLRLSTKFSKSLNFSLFSQTPSSIQDPLYSKSQELIKYIPFHNKQLQTKGTINISNKNFNSFPFDSKFISARVSFCRGQILNVIFSFDDCTALNCISSS